MNSLNRNIFLLLSVLGMSLLSPRLLSQGCTGALYGDSQVFINTSSIYEGLPNYHANAILEVSWSQIGGNPTINHLSELKREITWHQPGTYTFSVSIRLLEDDDGNPFSTTGEENSNPTCVYTKTVRVMDPNDRPDAPNPSGILLTGQDCEERSVIISPSTPAPTENIEWYWYTDQDHAFSANAPAFKRLEGGGIEWLDFQVIKSSTVHLKAYDNFLNLWSEMSYVGPYVNVARPPQTPWLVTSTTYFCKETSAYLGVGEVEDVTPYWYADNAGQADLNTVLSTNSIYNFFPTNNTSFHIRYLHKDGCWGPFKKVDITVSECANNRYNSFTTHTLYKEGVKQIQEIENLGPGEVFTQISYLDGIGRTMQNVDVRASPTRQDIIHPMGYDKYWREPRTYLSYTKGTTGAYKLFAIEGLDGNYTSSEQYNFFQNQPDISHTTVPYDEIRFEQSPLNRVIETGYSGESWAIGNHKNFFGHSDGHTVRKLWYPDVPWWGIRNWEIGYLPSDRPVISTVQPEFMGNKIWVEETYNEHDAIVREFIDIQGRVLIRESLGTLNSGKTHRTEYVYDDFGNLRFILPPKATDLLKGVNWNYNITPEIRAQLDELVFYYVYDSRHRVILRKVPGKKEEKLVYDYLDRLVMSQDGQQSEEGDWSYTLYDELSRPVVTGIYHNLCISHESIQDYYNTVQTSMYQEQEIQFEDQLLDNRVLPDDLGFVNEGVLKSYLARESMELNSHTQSQSYTWEPNPDEAHLFEIRSIALDPSETYSNSLMVTGLPELPGCGMSEPSSIEHLTITNYDDYTFLDEGAFAFEASHFEGTSIDFLSAPKEQITGVKVKVLGTDRWITKVNYYDDNNRIIQVQTENHKGGIDIISTHYQSKLVDWITQTITEHHNPLDPVHTQIQVLESSEYDHNGRLMKSVHQVNEQDSETLSEFTYNELGKLLKKKLSPQIVSEPGVSPPEIGYLQVIDYQYNSRGWLKGINELELLKDDEDPVDLFGMGIHYDEPFLHDGVSGNMGIAQYNGNISGIRWKTRWDKIPRSYSFEYDPFDRLLGADYRKGTADTSPGNDPNSWDSASDQFQEDYSVPLIRYDVNGNITTVQRKGLAQWNDPDPLNNAGPTYDLIDDLVYTFEGNRLISVDDARDTSPTNHTGLAGDFTDYAHGGAAPIKAADGDEYCYDLNGNMTFDANKNIQISYNHLNLPSLIEFSGNRRIKYIYDANGVKLAKEVYDNNILISKTDYIGSFIYQNDVLEFFTTSEGRCLAPSQTDEANYVYEYHILDHLGNLRVACRWPKNADPYVASMEYVSSLAERREFLHIEQTRDDSWNHTEGGLSSSRLNAKAGEDRPLGPLKEFKVGKGDKIEAKVWAHYQENADPNQRLGDLSVFLSTNPGYSQQADEFGIPVNEQESILNTLQAGVSFRPHQAGSNQEEVPIAYLRVLVYDEGRKVIQDYTLKVNEEAKTATGQEYVLKNPFNSEEEFITIQKEGFVQIFVANESEVDVWFDDLEVQHNSDILVQENHYYPFGLNMAGIEKQGRPEHKFQFQGQEKQDEFGLNWSSFKWRNADVQLGRFHSVDPLAEDYVYNSSYAFSENKVTGHVELEGLESWPAIYGTPDPRAAAYGDPEGVSSDPPEGEPGAVKQFFDWTSELVLTGISESSKLLNENVVEPLKEGLTTLYDQGLDALGWEKGPVTGTAPSPELVPLAVGVQALREKLPESLAETTILASSLSPVTRIVRGAARGVTVSSSAGGRTLPMTLQKIIPQGSKISNIVNDVKGMTWMTGNEHAVVRLANGQKAIVSGGPGGISFRQGQIKTLFGHTHPTTAPPSSGDYNALRILGQSRQYVIHGGQTTLIRP